MSEVICEFVVPGPPVTWARAGRRGNITFTPKRQRDYMDMIRARAVQAMTIDNPYDGPVEVEMMFYIPIPKSWPKAKVESAIENKIYPMHKMDWDNLGKIQCDAMNDLVYVDDGQIIRATATKRYSLTPMAHITVSALSDWDF